MLESDPLDQTAINNLGIIYGELRDNERAEQSYRQSIALNPDQYVPGYWNLVQTLIHLGKFDEARQTIDTVTRRFGPRPAAYLRLLVTSNEGDLERGVDLVRGFMEEVDPGPRIRGDLGAMLGTLGRLNAARQEMDMALDATRDEAPAEFWEDAIQRAWLDLTVVDGGEAALGIISRAESEVPLASLAVLDRPYGPLVELLARAGSVERAEELRAEIDAEVPAEMLPTMKLEIARADGEIALAHGRLDEAIVACRRSDRGYCEICPLYGLGAAYDRAGQADSAISAYTRYVETPFPDRYASYAYALGPALGPALERLAQLYDERGDQQDAVRFYARFVELWANADEQLQPRVRTAQARLEEILREIG
jgi:tetratricopeptide (TPR) repeat protein